MYVHWAPKDSAKLLDAKAWKTEPIPATTKQSRWMFGMPVQVDGRNGLDLVVGSKEPNAMIGWLESPAKRRDLTEWKLHRLDRAGWIMSIVPIDMDGDGDLDILLSDRKGKRSGVKWLEHPGVDGISNSAPWKEHAVGGAGLEAMFLSVADLDGDGLQDVLCAVRPSSILAIRRLCPDGDGWKSYVVPMPPRNRAGTSKGVAAADINGDGRLDLLATCENADGRLSGVWWIDVDCFADHPDPIYHDIGGAEGVKYDLIQLLDLDGDGDLDLATCEERDNLGVVWYENPGRPPVAEPHAKVKPDGAVSGRLHALVRPIAALTVCCRHGLDECAQDLVHGFWRREYLGHIGVQRYHETPLVHTRCESIRFRLRIVEPVFVAKFVACTPFRLTARCLLHSPFALSSLLSAR
jgi:hypothetical protein